uniref:Uncharacterized protein n=1 Tax=Chenopodium quinoa TaxID=63459 RepID=A0A803NEV0_CHEQI
PTFDVPYGHLLHHHHHHHSQFLTRNEVVKDETLQLDPTRLEDGGETQRSSSSSSLMLLPELPWSNDEMLALFRIRSSMDNTWFPDFIWENVSRLFGELEELCNNNNTNNINVDHDNDGDDHQKGSLPDQCERDHHNLETCLSQGDVCVDDGKEEEEEEDDERQKIEDDEIREDNDKSNDNDEVVEDEQQQSVDDSEKTEESTKRVMKKRKKTEEI